MIQGPRDGQPFRVGEIFPAEITAHYPPKFYEDPDPDDGDYLFPRRYDWVDPTGRFVQPPLLPWGDTLNCDNVLSEVPGQANNIAERTYDAIVTHKPVPIGTPVLLYIAFYPPFVDPNDCTPDITLQLAPPPFICFYLHVDPWSAYCGCNPETDPECPPHAEP